MIAETILLWWLVATIMMMIFINFNFGKFDKKLQNVLSTFEGQIKVFIVSLLMMPIIVIGYVLFLLRGRTK